MSGRTAIVAGASGLVGGRLLALLLADPTYSRVVALGRRRLAVEHPKLVQRQAGADAFEVEARAAGAEDAFCCLGTTLAKAGSREAFRRLDFDAIVAFARGAKAGGARRFVLVSSAGADPRSRVFYSRVKGETEEAVAALGFEACHILRPSLLLGPRPEKRLFEGLAQRLMGPAAALMAGPLRRYRPIEAGAVASAMIRLARTEERGVRRWESERL